MVDERIRRARRAQLEANAGPVELAYSILARLGIVNRETVEAARVADRPSRVLGTAVSTTGSLPVPQSRASEAPEPPRPPNQLPLNG